LKTLGMTTICIPSVVGDTFARFALYNCAPYACAGWQIYDESWASFRGGNWRCDFCSVAAEILADNGIRVAVFEQNTRPYGKIEDVLPRWHVEAAQTGNARIDARMKKQNVYSSATKLGPPGISVSPASRVGLFAVILCQWCVARPGIGRARKRSSSRQRSRLQNPFIYWYNHKNEKDYRGQRFETPDEL